MSKLQDIYRKHIFSKKLVYCMNNHFKHIKSVKNCPTY